MKKLIVILFVSLILLSCSDKLSQIELTGIYIWNNGQNGKLRVNGDMTYSYKFNLSANDSLQNIGIWRFDSLKQEILFDDFKFSQSDKIKGTWISRVQKRKNEIHLIYASDSEIFLKKIE